MLIVKIIDNVVEKNVEGGPFKETSSISAPTYPLSIAAEP